mgnify:CR=1 FL=1
MITEIENFPSLLTPELLEKELYSIVQATKGTLAGKVIKMLDSTNRFYTMIASKAKGKDLNLAQITGALG